VAHRKAFEVATILHGMELSEDEVKVMVEEVPVSFALVHVPTDGVYNVSQTFQCFLVGLEIWLILTP